ncbi:uncharacterized protein BXZ73DRAFT_50119 [Epithele typhae]|uniref:uncharacterized protein n=1 Tax=Epithele typhae TaxID=378194 RepID=UPI002008BEAE|nr:uncharacterized protein BXZ73DRAFT_50119 [Epithele typhae]KAH9925026.1 hypothetical protein BXZ73DRAFT_50119 [Epithele typhae]
MKQPGTPGPRARVPALRGSTSTLSLPLNKPQASDAPRHPHFYKTEGMVVLKVEGSLYRVHKYLLEQQSEFFRQIICEDRDAMGHTDDHPLPLPETITQQAFDCLLNFLYSGIYDPQSIAIPDWVILLRIATRLQFPKVRAYAVRELSARRCALSPVDALVLAKEHDIPAWCAPAYADLVRRTAPLSEDEAERLGARAAVRVARAREVLRAEEFAQHQHRQFGARYAPPETRDEQLVTRTVSEVFQLPASQVCA